MPPQVGGELREPLIPERLNGSDDGGGIDVVAAREFARGQKKVSSEFSRIAAKSLLLLSSNRFPALARRASSEVEPSAISSRFFSRRFPNGCG
jgi:hypothetical protein